VSCQYSGAAGIGRFFLRFGVALNSVMMTILVLSLSVCLSDVISYLSVSVLVVTLTLYRSKENKILTVSGVVSNEVDGRWK